MKITNFKELVLKKKIWMKFFIAVFINWAFSAHLTKYNKNLQMRLPDPDPVLSLIYFTYWIDIYSGFIKDYVIQFSSSRIVYLFVYILFATVRTKYKQIFLALYLSVPKLDKNNGKYQNPECFVKGKTHLTIIPIN